MLPEQLKAPIRTYLAALDESLPGLLTGLYVVGSVALDDYQERVSNIDLLAVSHDPWPEASLTPAARIHHELEREGPAVVAYISVADLMADPRQLDVACFKGKHPVPSDDLVNPLTWHLVAKGCPTLRGPPHPLVLDNIDATRDWATDRLRTAWWPRLAHLGRSGKLLFRPYVSAMTLEVCRLSVMAEAGTVLSKTEAAEAVQGRLPRRFHRIVDDAIGYRTGGHMSLYWGAFERRRDVLSLVAELVTLSNDGTIRILRHPKELAPLTLHHAR
jgi:hypothetical protein